MCKDNCKEGITMDVKKEVLIIGSGIAALQAALLLEEHFKIQIVTKSSVHTSSSYRAQGGIAAVTSEEDHIDCHIADTLKAGEFHHESRHVQMLIEEGTKIIRNYLQAGFPIDRHSNGAPALGLEGAHSHHRILHAGGDRTGQIFIDYLLHKLSPNTKVNCYEMAYELLLNTNGDCVGVLTKGCEGDGIALAFRAGAAISDMEFMQFHPSLLWCENEAKGLISEAVRGAGGIFVDAHRRPIMKGIHAQLDLAPRHITALALFNKRAAGEETFLDISSIQNFDVKFPSITQLCRNNHIDLQDGLVPVSPGSHFLMGGIIADDKGRTTIANLYAIGEVACTGVHGANRLASNSLLEGITFGQKMAHFIIQQGCSQKDFLLANDKNVDSMPSLFSKQQLQQHMMQYLGIVRNGDDLQYSLQQLPSIQALLHANLKGLQQTELELYMMHVVATLITHAAITRTETRGAHIRSDKPAMEAKWANRWIIFSQGQMKVRNSLYEYHQTRGNAQTIF